MMQARSMQATSVVCVELCRDAASGEVRYRVQPGFKTQLGTSILTQFVKFLLKHLLKYLHY